MILRVLLAVLAVLTALCETERILYVSTEHPVLLFYSKKYFDYANITSKRYGRKDPFHYVDVNFQVSSYYFGNNISIHFYFYEFLTNRYERGFVELHFKFCDLIHHDKLFGAPLKQGRLAGPCPYPPGVYNLRNMTISIKHIPRNFPFKKGRIYCNLTYPAAKETIFSAYINMEIKEWRVSNKSAEHS